MVTILSHISSLRFLRSLSGPDNARPSLAETQELKEATLSHYDLERLAPLFGDAHGAVHFLVANDNAKRSLPGAVCHRFSCFPNQDAFIRVMPHVFASGPELCFQQLSESQSPGTLALVGMELCGAFAPNEFDARGFKSREALTTPSRILMQLSTMPYRTALPFAREIALYLVANARSPMEARIATELCLPRKWGGYHLPAPTLNASVANTKAASLISGRRYFECDLHWPKSKLVVEYDSKDFHCTSQQRLKDESKRTALLKMGYTVITLTPDQVLDRDKMRIVVETISKQLGLRLRIRSNKFDDANQTLRQQFEQYKTL